MSNAENEQTELEENVTPEVEEEPTELDDPKVFDEDYVKELREENKRYRLRAKQVDELSHRLHRELVKADGRLQDASDLDFDEAHLEDDEALKAAIDSLLESKPHLKARRATGDIGAGKRGDSQGRKPFDLISHLKSS